MVPVNNPRGGRGSHPGRSGHLTFGFLGFGLAVVLFLAGYSAIVALAHETMGLLASTAVVWLFIAAWLVLWLGMDVAVLGLSGRRSGE